MQYIMTEEEFKQRVPRAELETARYACDMLRHALLESKKFVCIHALDADFKRINPDGYCDYCPVIKIADATGADTKVLCPLSKRFSK